MFLGVDKGTFSLSVVTPEDKNQMVFGGGEAVNNGVGKLFPAFILVGAGLMGANGEGGVEEKHPLLGPTLEVAGLGEIKAEIGFYFFVDIDKGGGESNAVGYGKGEAVSLAGAVIWILAEDDNLNFINGETVQGIKNKFRGRVNRAVFIFLFNKLGEVFKIGLIKFVF